MRAALFRGRHFTDEIIVLCVRWYLRYSLSYRDLTEIMCERNLLANGRDLSTLIQGIGKLLRLTMDKGSNPKPFTKISSSKSIVTDNFFESDKKVRPTTHLCAGEFVKR
jgi:hypothetical protein